MTIRIPPPAGTGDYSIQTVNVPRVILSFTGTATVMEILKVWWYVGINDLADNDIINGGYLSFRSIRGQDAAASLATIAADMEQPSVFATFRLHILQNCRA